jgi:hypothetical protein
MMKKAGRKRLAEKRNIQVGKRVCRRYVRKEGKENVEAGFREEIQRFQREEFTRGRARKAAARVSAVSCCLWV